jgi:hypothetical protein
MAESRKYIYLGEIEGPGLAVPRKLWLGHYTALTGDAYPRVTTQVSWLFPGLSVIDAVLALYGDMANNVGNMLCLSERLGYARADDGGVFTDEDAAANQATADDMTLLPAAPAVDDAYYFGSSYPFNGLELRISTSGAGVWTITWEYYNGTAWVTIPGVADATVGFTAAAGLYRVAFRAPGDWAAVAVNAVTCFWVRARVSAYTSIVTQPLGQQAFIRDRGNRVLAAVIEHGADGDPFDEKPAENYGQNVNFYCLVAGH